MDNEKLEQLWQVVISIILAAAGGLARLLSIKDKHIIGFVRIISELFISSFTGMMMLLLARASGLSGDWLGLAAGMSGWIGPRVLDALAKAVSKATKINMD